MNVLFQIIPDNATSKYKLILLCITVNALKHIGRTDSHSHHTQFTPSTVTTVLATGNITFVLLPHLVFH